MNGAVSGMMHMFAACIILVLAWGLARASKDLQLGPVVQSFLLGRVKDGTFSITYLPLAVFLTASFISFSTGMSWGTMAILIPPVVAIAAGLVAPMAADQARAIFYASVGAAMGGAVFGNTCSPLADDTVLSSIFSECDLAAHVRTTLPYAIVVAAVSLICTDGSAALLRRFAPDAFARYWSIYAALGVGAILLLLLLLVVGRRPPRPTNPESLSM
jgi:Na+/H+ antiporter NhaC